jgi:biopolymer transport protein ExbB
MNNIKDMVLDGKLDAAGALCKAESTPVARMIEKGISRIGKPLGDITQAIENQGKLEVTRLEKGLPMLATISGGAPMIGFLGTVIGMILTFKEMANAGRSNQARYDGRGDLYRNDHNRCGSFSWDCSVFRIQLPSYTS